MGSGSGRRFVTLVDEAELERIAEIAGEQSAARVAFEELDRRRGLGENPVVVRHGVTFLVVTRAELIPFSTPPHP